MCLDDGPMHGLRPLRARSSKHRGSTHGAATPVAGAGSLVSGASTKRPSTSGAATICLLLGPKLSKVHRRAVGAASTTIGCEDDESSTTTIAFASAKSPLSVAGRQLQCSFPLVRQPLHVDA
jgi:hypothetical protein